MIELSIVMPTFNEQIHIERTINRICSNLKKLKLKPEIIIIDDSKDNTYKILKKLAKKHRNLKVMHRINKKGVGSAIRYGIDKSNGKYVIIFMADAPDDAKYFPMILEKLREEYDIVQTSRFFKKSKIIGYPFKKRVCNWLCNNFIKIAFCEFRLKDFSSLFKGFRKDKIKHLNLSANEFDLGLEIALKAMRKNYRIIEVPVNWAERKEGKSKLKLSKFAKHYFMRVMKIWLSYW